MNLIKPETASLYTRWLHQHRKKGEDKVVRTLWFRKRPFTIAYKQWHTCLLCCLQHKPSLSRNVHLQMASEPQKRLSAKTPVCVCLHGCSHPTQRLCQLLREGEIRGMHRDINATPWMCVSVYLCQGGVRRQLRFHIAPRKRLELEACYNAKYTHIHAHVQEDIWRGKFFRGNEQYDVFIILFLTLLYWQHSCWFSRNPCCILSSFINYLILVIFYYLQNDGHLVFSFESKPQLSVLGHNNLYVTYNKNFFLNILTACTPFCLSKGDMPLIVPPLGVGTSFCICVCFANFCWSIER